MNCFLPAIETEEENGVDDVLACDDGGQMAMQATIDIPKPRNRRQAIESQEWDKWRKAEETEMLGMVENCVYKQVARPKDKLVTGTKIIYKQNKRIGRQGREVQVSTCRSRVLAGERCALHGKVLAHAISCVHPDASGDGSSQGWEAAPFRRRAGIFEGGY